MRAGSAAILFTLRCEGAASALACRIQALPPLNGTLLVPTFFTTPRTF
jgi:hypothetical protein